MDNMTEQIETKWQYIARVYREIGDERCAGIADEIDTLLSTIPEYTRTTADWDDDIASGLVDNMGITDVIQCIGYCTACAHTEDYNLYCDDCIFEARGGRELYFALRHSSDGDDI